MNDNILVTVFVCVLFFAQGCSENNVSFAHQEDEEKNIISFLANNNFPFADLELEKNIINARFSIGDSKENIISMIGEPNIIDYVYIVGDDLRKESSWFYFLSKETSSDYRVNDYRGLSLYFGVDEKLVYVLPKNISGVAELGNTNNLEIERYTMY